MVWRKAAYPAGMKTIRQLTKDIFKRGVQAIEANKNYSPQRFGNPNNLCSSLISNPIISSRRKKAIELLGDQIFGAEFKSVKEFHAYRNQILVDELVYAQHVDIRRKKSRTKDEASGNSIYFLHFQGHLSPRTKN